MNLEKENLSFLNGSFFKIDFNTISRDNLRNILKTCGLKSNTGSLNNQIKMLEDIRRYLLNGNVLELNKALDINPRCKELKGSFINYKDIINENNITYELIIKSIRKNPIVLENIMLNQSVNIFDIIECCSNYLDIPRNIISNEDIYKKIEEILIQFDISVLKE